MQESPDKTASSTDTDQRAAEFERVFGRSRSGPLRGVLVADFSRVLAGPYCTMLLADLGATVIKVEGPGGDDTRNWRPPVHDGESTYYLSINRNKHSIVLDFADAADLVLAQQLTERADVVIENFKPNGLIRFGLDYAAVRARNPGAVYASITGFGTGAGAGLPGYDLLVQAMSGLMSITGAADTGPFRTGVAVFDVITGLHACVGLLAALREREATGAGQHVELNLLSSALSGLVNQTAAYAIAGVVPQRMGTEHPSIYPYEPFDTGADQLVIAIGNDRQFAVLCRELGRPDLADDPRFAAAVERSRNRTALRPLLVEALADRSAAAWFDRLSPLGIPCAPILDVEGGVRAAQRLGLDPIVSAGGQPTIANPITFSATPTSYDVPPPALDADGDLVRRWLANQAH